MAAPVAAPAPAPAPVAPRASVKERLSQLDALRTDGIVTEAEYQARRAQILADI